MRVCLQQRKTGRSQTRGNACKHEMEDLVRRRKKQRCLCVKEGRVACEQLCGRGSCSQKTVVLLEAVTALHVQERGVPRKHVEEAASVASCGSRS